MLILSTFPEIEIVLNIKNRRIYKTREAKVCLYNKRKLITFISPKEYRNIA